MGRLLGIDYGRKRIGIAVTDEMRMIASPLDILHNNKDILDGVARLCREYSVDAMVIGYPFSETYRESSRAVEKFALALEEKTGLKVYFQNEEFSTVYMESFLRSMGMKDKDIKAKIDKYAAQKILQDYLKARPAG